MIDLDFLEEMKAFEKDNSLYIELGIAYCRGWLTYVDWQRACRFFLGDWKYVLPHQRETLPELSDFLYKNRKYNLFSLAIVLSNLESHYTATLQMEILDRLLARMGDSMEKSPEFVIYSRTDTPQSH